MGKISGDRIYDKASRILGKFDGRTLKDKGNRKLADRRDIEKDIDGHGGVTLAALWLFFVR